MENYNNNSQFVNFSSTFFFEESKPSFTTKQLSPYIIVDTIRQSLIEQYEYTFGAKPHTSVLESMVDGFVLFNLHKNKYMLKRKTDLLKYVKDKTISLEEKDYFLNIILYNQRPRFLTFDEHQYLRACGDLEGFNNV